jgi:hypothetical protein
MQNLTDSRTKSNPPQLAKLNGLARRTAIAAAPLGLSIAGIQTAAAELIQAVREFGTAFPSDADVERACLDAIRSAGAGECLEEPHYCEHGVEHFMQLPRLMEGWSFILAKLADDLAEFALPDGTQREGNHLTSSEGKPSM